MLYFDKTVGIQRTVRKKIEILTNNYCFINFLL